MQKRREHSIDLLFPILLFFLFTLTALVVLLFAARIYRSSAEQAARNDTARTVLSYLSEKVHQVDADHVVSIGTFDGCDALVFTQEVESSTYYTYIYPYQNALYELFIKEGANATAENGKKIAEIASFSMETLNDHLIQFHCGDADGHFASITVSLQSGMN